MNTKELREWWHLYCRNCRSCGMKPLSFRKWISFVGGRAVQAISHDLAKQIKDPSKAIYLARRVTDLVGDWHPPGIVIPCDKCHEPCQIDKTMAKNAYKSKMVICNVCCEEVTGRPIEDIVLEMLKSI